MRHHCPWCGRHLTYTRNRTCSNRCSTEEEQVPLSQEDKRVWREEVIPFLRRTR